MSFQSISNSSRKKLSTKIQSITVFISTLTFLFVHRMRSSSNRVGFTEKKLARKKKILFIKDREAMFIFILSRILGGNNGIDFCIKTERLLLSTLYKSCGLANTRRNEQVCDNNTDNCKLLKWHVQELMEISKLLSLGGHLNSQTYFGFGYLLTLS